MSGSMIEISLPEGGQLNAYLSTPEVGQAPGIVVVSTIYGVDSDITGIADQLATDGFVVSAPDMFWRDAPGAIPVTEEGSKRAMSRGQGFDQEQGMTDFAAIIENLKAHPQCNGKMAVIGFCFGGPFAFLSAARLGIDAGLSFHGSFVGKHLAEAVNIKCPLSFYYGDQDHVASMEEIGEIKDAFDQLENADVFIYPGLGHGYMLPSRGDGYFPAEAALSWERAMKVLNAI